MVAVVGIAAAGNVHLDGEIEIVRYLRCIRDGTGPILQPNPGLCAPGVRLLPLRGRLGLGNGVSEVAGRTFEILDACLERSAVDHRFAPVLTENPIGVTSPVV